MEQSVHVTDLYDILSKKLDRETAKSLTDYVTIVINEKFTESKSEIATKDFVRSEISQAKTDIIKWVVGVGVSAFIALALMIIGLYIKK